SSNCVNRWLEPSIFIHVAVSSTRPTNVLADGLRSFSLASRSSNCCAMSSVTATIPRRYWRPPLIGLEGRQLLQSSTNKYFGFGESRYDATRIAGVLEGGRHEITNH